MDMTYYEILQVSENASPEVVSMAYKALVRKYHPDTFQGNQEYATAMMVKLNEAYGILNDPEKRTIYDRLLKDARRTETGGSGSGQAQQQGHSRSRSAGAAEAPHSAAEPHRGRAGRARSKKRIAITVLIVIAILLILFGVVLSLSGALPEPAPKQEPVPQQTAPQQVQQPEPEPVPESDTASAIDIPQESPEQELPEDAAGHMISVSAVPQLRVGESAEISVGYDYPNADVQAQSDQGTAQWSVTVSNGETSSVFTITGIAAGTGQISFYYILPDGSSVQSGSNTVTVTE